MFVSLNYDKTINSICMNKSIDQIECNVDDVWVYREGSEEPEIYSYYDGFEKFLRQEDPDYFSGTIPARLPNGEYTERSYTVEFEDVIFCHHNEKDFMGYFKRYVNEWEPEPIKD